MYLRCVDARTAVALGDFNRIESGRLLPMTHEAAVDEVNLRASKFQEALLSAFPLGAADS